MSLNLHEQSKVHIVNSAATSSSGQHLGVVLTHLRTCTRLAPTTAQLASSRARSAAAHASWHPWQPLSPS
jgi:hypothetical protein